MISGHWLIVRDGAPIKGSAPDIELQLPDVDELLYQSGWKYIN
jgi:hypothetical protein